MPRSEGRPPPDPARLRERLFPDSLCHDCAAPVRYVTNDRGSTFLYCPIFKRYPPQPVRECEEFRPIRPSADGET